MIGFVNNDRTLGNVLMTQPIRQTAVRPQSFWDTVRERIDISVAVDNLNLMLVGKTVEPQVERSTLFLLNKTIPGLQAVAISIEDSTTTSMQDIMLKAQSLGIDESDLFSTPETKQLILQEKTESVLDQSEGGHPPDVDT